MDCEKCSQRINASDLYIVCEGKCAKRFHIVCVSITEDQLFFFTKNIIWICDACLVDFNKYRNHLEPEQKSKADNAVAVHDEITDLKNKVADIMKTLASITPKETGPVHHSTPISLAKVHDGSNMEYGSSRTNEESSVSHLQSSDNQTFALYITNIDSQVTEQEIGCMVHHCLGIPHPECVGVTKLVPKGKVCSTLDFVSFKVVVSERWKSLAMTASTWPNGVRFREFEKRHNTTWKP